MIQHHQRNHRFRHGHNTWTDARIVSSFNGYLCGLSINCDCLLFLRNRRSRLHSNSNDNIFAALDVPDAEEWLAKAELARAIQRHITARRMTQMQAAVALGGAQSDISNLARGRLAGYSIERLCRFLNALGQDVRIVVQPKPRTRRQATVRAMVLRTA